MASINYCVQRVCAESGKKKESLIANTREDLKVLAKLMARDAFAYDQFMAYVASKAPKTKKRKEEG